MASRITSLLPVCGYSPGGITSVQLLDIDDFTGFSFEGGLYDSCIVTDIGKTGDFIDVQSSAAKYNGPYTAKIINHTLDTFVETLPAALIANAHLASRKRYIVKFSTAEGREHLFGYDAGATVTYSAQTDGAAGFMLTITAPSIYPLFELSTPKPISDGLARFGLLYSNTVPTIEQIGQLAGQQFTGGGDYVVNFPQTSVPMYLCIAEPLSEPVKLRWQDTENPSNDGDIGASLFYAPVQVGGYRVYISMYKTIVINPLKVIH